MRRDVLDGRLEEVHLGRERRADDPVEGEQGVDEDHRDEDPEGDPDEETPVRVLAQPPSPAGGARGRAYCLGGGRHSSLTDRLTVT